MEEYTKITAEEIDYNRLISSGDIDRVMLEETFTYLRERQQQILLELSEMRSDVDGHQRQEHHDNAGAVFAENQMRAELNRIGDLKDVIIIMRPEAPQKVGLGAKVRLRYENDLNEIVEAVVGAPRDVSVLKETVVSILSPIGSAILGKTTGETVSFQAKNSPLVQVQIIDVS